MMLSTDPIADMLTRLRNAIAVRKNVVSVPHSKMKENIAKLLKKSNFVDNIKISDTKDAPKEIVITINALESNARITEITRMSKPGRRYYVGHDKIPTVKRGRGLVIVSTSKGLMTGSDAKKQNLGGELICKVY